MKKLADLARAANEGDISHRNAMYQQTAPINAEAALKVYVTNINFSFLM